MLCETQERIFFDLNILEAPPRLLDIGCSDLRCYSRVCQSVAGNYVGIDLDSDALASARIRAPSVNATNLVNGSGEALPFAEDVFDLVVLNDVLAYCDRTLMLSEVRRVLVPGGLVVSLHNNSIGWSFYKLIFPEKAWPTEWVHSFAVIGNTLQSSLTGRRLFRTTYNTPKTLYSAVAAGGLDMVRFWSTKSAYCWYHFVARKPRVKFEAPLSERLERFPPERITE